MSYDVPTKKYPIAADVDALATFLAQRQSDSATTNGGIVATGSPAVLQMGVDAAGLSLAYLKGMADALLCASGFQAENIISGFSANTYSNTPLVDIPGSSWTFNAPIAKRYTVDVDTLMFFTAGANPFGALRLVVNGDPGPTVTFHTVTLNLLMPIHTAHTALCVAGANTIKLQWSCNSATYTVNVGASTYANYTVRG